MYQNSYLNRSNLLGNVANHFISESFRINKRFAFLYIRRSFGYWSALFEFFHSAPSRQRGHSLFRVASLKWRIWDIKNDCYLPSLIWLLIKMNIQAKIKKAAKYLKRARFPFEKNFWDANLVNAIFSQMYFSTLLFSVFTLANIQPSWIHSRQPSFSSY